MTSINGIFFEHININSSNGSIDSSCDWLNDRGLAYGDGLFETIVAIDGQLINWPLHWQRLLTGCEKLKLSPPIESKLLGQLNKDINGNACVVKVIITRKSSGRGYNPATSEINTYSFTTDYPEYDDACYTQGVKVRFCQTRLALQPLLAGIKHLNRLEQVLARGEWQQEYHEGLMCDMNGAIIEGTMSNLFWINGGTLYTAPVNECGIAGTQRQFIINHWESLGKKIEYKAITADLLIEQDEIFLCNSVIGIWPVTQLDKKSFSIGTITQQLMDIVNPLLKRSL